MLSCRFCLRPFRHVTVSGCGLSGLWPFRSTSVLDCGRFGLFGLLVVALLESGRYDLLPLLMWCLCRKFISRHAIWCVGQTASIVLDSSSSMVIKPNPKYDSKCDYIFYNIWNNSVWFVNISGKFCIVFQNLLHEFVQDGYCLLKRSPSLLMNFVYYSYLYHQSQCSKTWDSKCLAFGMNPKVGGSSPPQVETFSFSKTLTLSQEHPFVCRKWMQLLAHS